MTPSINNTGGNTNDYQPMGRVTRRDEDNVSINDGEMTYFAEWNDLTDVIEMTRD
jgi:hypothetical protein